MTSIVIGALVLMAGLIAAILATRGVSANKENTARAARAARASGYRFFFLWFFVGGLLALMTFVMFLMAAVGGVSTPPGIWMIFWGLGLVALPVLLALGGLPAAVQISHGREWKKTALITLAVCITSWVVIAGIVFFGPSIFGWSW